MCEEKGFNEDRIRNGIKKLAKARNTSTQGRLDSFFKILPSPSSTDNKRKVRKAAYKMSCYEYTTLSLI